MKYTHKVISVEQSAGRWIKVGFRKRRPFPERSWPNIYLWFINL